MEEELSDTRPSVLRRLVADIIPLTSVLSHKVGKKKQATNDALALIEGYSFKEIYKAIGRRQDQQKYYTFHLRAKEFIKLYPFAKEPENRIEEFYKKKGWSDIKATKKVCLQFKITKISPHY